MVLQWLAQHRKWVDLGITATKAVLLMSSFVLPAWAVHASEWLNSWGPIAWVTAGFAGVGCTLCLMIAHAFWKRYRLTTRILEHQATKPDFVNPLEDTFRKQRIRLTDLAEPVSGYVRNKVFIECEIFGPANAVALPGCVFQANGGELVDALIFDRAKPATGTHLEFCTFRKCRFYGVTFMVPAVFAEEFHRHNWSGLNWITSGPESLDQSELEFKPKVTEAD